MVLGWLNGCSLGYLDCVRGESRLPSSRDATRDRERDGAQPPSRGAEIRRLLGSIAVLAQCHLLPASEWVSPWALEDLLLSSISTDNDSSY